MSKPKLNRLKRVSLQQTSIFFFSGVAAIVFMALLTHSSTDCGFFNYDSQCVVTNKAGGFGAYLSDILLAFFGYLAFLIPFALVVVGIVMFRFPVKKNPNNPTGGVNAWLSVTGLFMALFAGSGLATLLWPDVDLIYRGGGLLGLGVVKAIHTQFGDYGSALLLLSLFFAGITLLADIKWGSVAEVIGTYSLKVFDYIVNMGGEKKDEVKLGSNGEFDGRADPLDQDISSSNYQDDPPVAGNKTGLGQQASAFFNEKSQWLKAKVKTILPSAEPSLVASYADSPDPLTESVLNIPRDSDFAQTKTQRQFQERSVASDPVLSSGATLHSSSQQPSGSAPASQVVAPEPLSVPDASVTATLDNRSIQTPAPSSESSVQAQAFADTNVIPAPYVESPESAQPSHTVSEKAAVATAPAFSKMKSLFGLGSGEAREKFLPPISLLDPPPQNEQRYSEEYLQTMADNLVEALGHYSIKEATVENYFPGPVITRYEVQLKPGTKVSKVASIVKDLARTLGVPSVRLVEVIPGTTNIGIEVPNDTRNIVTIGSVIESDSFEKKNSPLTLVLGADIAGEPVSVDLGKMPHCLVAGTTGSGKSVGVNAMLLSILYKATAEDVKMILIDPKMLELSIYEDIPHLLTPVVTDMKDAANSLRWCVAEMERRYLLMSKLKVRNVAGFNDKVRKAQERGEPIIDPLYDPLKTLDVTPKALEPLPFIVIVIDEFADMMMVVGKKVEELIARLAQKARAAGIHLILATQRPSVDVITGLIKANIPTRIAFQVTSTTDSRTILDQMGAEQLLGKGDMLYLPPGSGLPQRVHGAFVADAEVDRVVTYVKEHQGEPDYLEDVLQEPAGDAAAIPGLEPLKDSKNESDPLYDEAVAVITESRRASISYLQRRLKVGYNRAARMIEDMESAGVVSEVQSNGTREVLAPPPIID